MRRAVLLLGLLAACRPADPERLAQQVEQQLQQSQWSAALVALHRAPTTPRFLLLRAEALLGQGNREAAEALLPRQPYSEAALEARRLMHLGRAANLRGENEAALGLLRQAATLAPPNSALAMAVDLRLLLALTKLNDFAAAEAAGRRALAYAQANRLPWAEIQASGNLGYIALNAHRYEEAISLFERVRRRDPSPGSLQKALGNLALCYLGLGDADRALDLFQRAEPLALAAGQQHDAMIWLGQSGNIFFERGDFFTAADRFRRALALSESLGGTGFTPNWAYNLARTYLDRNEVSAAEPLLAQAAKLAEPSDRSLRADLSVAAARIAEIHGQFPRAEVAYQAVATDTTLAPDDRREALGRLARLYARTHRTTQAGDAYRTLLALGEATHSRLERDDSRLSYGATIADLYAEYVDFLMERGQTLPALETAAAIRGRLLGGKPIRAAALRQLAAATGHVILFYSIGPTRSWLWTITPTAVHASLLPGANTLRPLLTNYNQLLEDLRDPRQSEDPGRRRLTEHLLHPAAAALPVGAQVYLVPDGPLHALNFETLASPHHPDRYWVEDATIAVVPAPSLLLEAARPPANAGTLLAGDPAVVLEPYQPLPHARAELAAIAAALPAGSARRLEGDQCSRSRLLAEPVDRYRYVHFALHAVANPLDPLHSSLLLNQRDDGAALTAAELRQMPWRAELVTLSACRSAGARNYPGEGLVGLAWAFLEAGAQNVIAGLWDVNDRSTASLMGALYRGIAQGQKPDAALRQAKLTLIHSSGPYAKPYYWAPFLYFRGAR
jgi:CHAT domain-containing protein/tetratricopeptide (TPR) repeat protein